MHQRLTDSRLANIGARSLRDGFVAYRTRFRDVTRRAAERFAARDWAGMVADAGERLDVYKQAVDRVEADIRTLLGERAQDPIVYASMKAVYSSFIADQDDWELAETFFNSVTRRVFATVGVDPRMEFVSSDFDMPPTPVRRPVTREIEVQGGLSETLDRVLAGSPIRARFADRAHEAALAAQAVEAHLAAAGVTAKPERLEIVDSVFYRGQAAYIVGRLVLGTTSLPLVLSLLHPSDGVRVDAVLLDEDSASILFSFAYSYFHVEVDRPWEVVRFLKSIVPRKRIAELYIALGFNKHGKTELYRNFLDHLARIRGALRDRTGTPGHGHVRVHLAGLRRRLQGDPRPVRLPEADRPARPSWTSTTTSSCTTAPAVSSMRRSSNTCRSSDGDSRPKCSTSSVARQRAACKSARNG